MKYRGLLVAGLVVSTVGVVALYLLSTNNASFVGDLPKGAPASTEIKPSTSLGASNTSRVIVAPDSGSRVIQAGGNSVPRIGHGSTSTQRAALWKNALSSLSIEETAIGLLASDDPNDWLRAVSLHILCINGFDRSDLVPDRVPQLDATFGRSFRQVATRFSARCGELGQEFLSRAPDVQARAVAANIPLALAPGLTNDVIKSGLSDDQFKRLAELFNDSEAATLWLTRNLRNLDTVLPNVDGFGGASREDLQAASVMALCLRGLDCGQDSVVSLKLCVNTAGKVCSDEGPLSALQQMDPQRSARINAAAQRIDAALTQGNPAALGIRRHPE